jgi:GNAT superfamily N-acetyltransferase
MSNFDENLQPHYLRPHLEYNVANIIQRYTVLLKDGQTTATIYPINSLDQIPQSLVGFLCDEFNMEIERGDTFAFFDNLLLHQFQSYWFNSFVGIMVLGDAPNLNHERQWEKECLGSFFIRSYHPGRCSHICTGNFLVNAGIRGKGIGRTLTDCFLSWAPRLGYTYCLFDLVFETNMPARRIWESLNFKRVGRIKSAGILKGHDQAIDILIYGRELINNSDPAVGAYRFDKIKYYLETGRYPAMADRQEKSRLRSSASHYTLQNGKLMLKGREVISDPVRQLQICQEIHLQNHGGINKTTTAITEKYHWTRIKDTVANAIKNCPECRDTSKDVPISKRNLVPKSMSSGHATNEMRNNKYGNDQSASTRNNDDVDAMVATVQLHNIPRNDNDSLLSHELAGLDDNLIAVVEEAQRQKQTHQNQHSPSQTSDQQQQQQQHEISSSYSTNGTNTYSPGASPNYQSTSNSSNNYQQFRSHYPYQVSSTANRKHRDGIPVDPEVENYSHSVNHSGNEIEIAQALMQAHDDHGNTNSRLDQNYNEEGLHEQSQDDEGNMFINSTND